VSFGFVRGGRLDAIKKSIGDVREVRTVMRKRKVPKSGDGVTWLRRNHARTAAAKMNSGELF
jgi:hypothetical protein